MKQYSFETVNRMAGVCDDNACHDAHFI